jgi:hypothetical protein
MMNRMKIISGSLIRYFIPSILFILSNYLEQESGTGLTR